MEIACVACVQRGGRWGVECEREARSRFALAFNFPPPSPLYSGHAGYHGNKRNYCLCFKQRPLTNPGLFLLPTATVTMN